MAANPFEVQRSLAEQARQHGIGEKAEECLREEADARRALAEPYELRVDHPEFGRQLGVHSGKG
nr:hypothetical protein GCM10020063_008160 [Dactylosporangium thailandense]